MTTTPESAQLLLHHRWKYDEPTACGLSIGVSTVSPSAVQCRACLAALGIKVDDRTPKQREQDLAAYLWQKWT